MREKGIALVIALATLLVVSGIGTLVFLRTLGEMRHSAQDQGIVQTLMLARGGANVGGSYLSLKAKERLGQIVGQTINTSSCWAYGSGGCQSTDTPDPASVAQALASLATSLQREVDGDICSRNLAPSGMQAAVSLRIYFTERACGQDLPPGTRLPPGRFVEGAPRTGAGSTAQTYALPFVMVAQAESGPYRRNVVLQGEYRFTVGRASFARWALFTNQHTLPNGSDVWFTDRTLFDGPVHTNGHFRFYRRPWFGGEVTSAGCLSPQDTGCGGQARPGAYFYGVNGGNLVPAGQMQPSAMAPSYTNSYGTHAPEFTAGVDWQAAFIPLPLNNQEQRSAAQASGLYFVNYLKTLELARKCINAQGSEVSCSQPLPGGVTKYQYITVEDCANWYCTRRVYRYAEDRKLYVLQGNSWVAFQRNGQQVVFNGVIFSEGGVGALRGPLRTRPDDPSTASPALADFAQITVAANTTIKISGDLRYETPPCTGSPKRNADGTVSPATCDNLGARNVLGVYSHNGDILIDQNAPRDIHIHASLMSAKGVIQVENYNSIPAKGSVHLIGGVIEKYYGAFGTFNSSTGQQQTGYDRAFTYDRRFLQGLAPPFFPTTGQDRVQNVVALSYGQREQVY
ncbi:MAG: DUF4900 domain-containing protein [Thermus sp.]|nr:DUF4900 domain-containing protein [Thermus sp.]